MKIISEDLKSLSTWLIHSFAGTHRMLNIAPEDKVLLSFVTWASSLTDQSQLHRPPPWPPGVFGQVFQLFKTTNLFSSQKTRIHSIKDSDRHLTGKQHIREWRVRCLSAAAKRLILAGRFTLPEPTPGPGTGGGGGKKEHQGLDFDLMWLGFHPGDREEFSLSSVETWLSFSFSWAVRSTPSAALDVGESRSDRFCSSLFPYPV